MGAAPDMTMRKAGASSFVTLGLLIMKSASEREREELIRESERELAWLHYSPMGGTKLRILPLYVSRDLMKSSGLKAGIVARREPWPSLESMTTVRP